MKKRILILLVFLPCVIPAVNANKLPHDSQHRSEIMKMNLNPLAFTENQGQWDDQVKFKANVEGATMWFTSEGVVYQFIKNIKSSDSIQVDPFQLPHDQLDHEPDSFEQLVLKASFVGANPNPTISGVDQMEYRCNYFIGNDPNEWHTDVPNYKAIYFEEIYSGIDLKYYGNGKQMEYDFIVSPGSDYTQIEIQYKGAKSLNVNSSGELVVETEWGSIIEKKSIVYQMDGKNRQLIEGQYNIADNNRFSFALNNYNTNLELVIDPALKYSTYLGGSGFDVAAGIAVDASGSAYITGITYSTDFPTLNPYQSSYQGNSDFFITKLSSTGNELLYSTYLGGSDGEESDDWLNSIAVDDFGCVYVIGSTYSTDFPTFNPYQSSNHGENDAFITKLSSTGNNLIYSTYMGGSAIEYGIGMAVDALGCAYISGYTASTDFPTFNPYQSNNQGVTDVFIAKLSATGSNLVYSTYLGGSDDDYGSDISVDVSGCAYVYGYTESANFPTANPCQSSYQGNWDNFVTKLSATGSNLVYSTYLGGSDGDYGSAIAVDALECAYLTGYTASTDFPIVNPFQSSLKGGLDAFVTKISNIGNSLIYSTYLGGSNNAELGYDIAVNASGCAYITGYTSSTDFPILNPYQNSHQGGWRDVFVTKFSNTGENLVYSTYLGGSEDDLGTAISIDASELAYVTSWTSSIDFPIVNPYQGNLNGGRDIVISKFCEDGDNDGYCNDSDNCPGVFNPNQEDFDSDGIGDVCDDCTDTDGDHYGNPGFSYNTCPDDNCPFIDNHTQDDSDNDNVGDACDDCPGYDDNVDYDGDLHPDGCDNCVFNYNPDQEDSNGDDIGDSCTYTDNTPAGDNIILPLGPSTIFFDNVTVEGETEMTLTTDGPIPPSSYTVVPLYPQIFYNITTTADYSGDIEICINYDDFSIPEEKELGLQLMHFVDPDWVDITSSLDTDANIICGITSSLSPFALMFSVDCGDASTDGSVNISDAVFIINYAFSGGPAPSSLEAADVNCDTNVNVSDAVYIINYAFSGGFAPCDTDGDEIPDC